MAGKMAGEIKDGFNAFGDAAKIAGYKRNLELVVKQGYVGLKNKEAIKLFQHNPKYKGWKCFIEGIEYRFYPPQDFDVVGELRKLELGGQEQKDVKVDPQIFETFKSKTQEAGYVYGAYIRPFNGKFEYRLVAQSKRTGESVELQKVEIEIDEEFLYKTVPSIYYYMCGKIPGIPLTKGDELTGFNFSIENFDGTKKMGFGGLSKEQLLVLEKMKEHIDENYMKIPNIKK